MPNLHVPKFTLHRALKAAGQVIGPQSLINSPHAPIRHPLSSTGLPRSFNPANGQALAEGSVMGPPYQLSPRAYPPPSILYQPPSILEPGRQARGFRPMGCQKRKPTLIRKEPVAYGITPLILCYNLRASHIRPDRVKVIIVALVAESGCPVCARR